MPHIPIMVEAVLNGLAVQDKAKALWVDGTLGAGGHSHAILSARGDNHLIACDRDPQALSLAKDRLSPFGSRAELHHASYVQLGEILAGRQADGILLDLGISSMQVDQAERGFSFLKEAPLDMRFDPSADIPSAAELINGLPEQDLADIFYHYGEERDSRRLAREIVKVRPIISTTQLAELINQLSRTPRHKQRIHPATRIFQALRIAVNDELGAVERVIPLAIESLKPGGRLAVMTFHSLEDRLVKNAFKLAATDCICPPQQPICTCQHRASVKALTRKPITADAVEVEMNSRARSAKLRLVEKL